MNEPLWLLYLRDCDKVDDASAVQARRPFSGGSLISKQRMGNVSRPPLLPGSAEVLAAPIGGNADCSVALAPSLPFLSYHPEEGALHVSLVLLTACSGVRLWVSVRCVEAVFILTDAVWKISI